MHVEVLLEEISARVALDILLPRLLPEGATFACHPHRGKNDLLARLPGRLKNYARLLPASPDWYVVVLMDADTDCKSRKKELEHLAAGARLLTKTSAHPGQKFQLLTRLAVAELEAWFLGDPVAIQAAYPRVHTNHFKGLPRDPDALSDTWETLHRLLQKGGYYPVSAAKTEWAATIAPHLDPARSTSASFRYFCESLAALR